jgi:hypothetical protein
MVKLTDFLWLLAAPVYLLIGTFRHEAAHAVVAWWGGATITAFVFWPTIYRDKLYWGYVAFDGPSSWQVTAAPYFLDLLTFLLFFCLCTRIDIKRRWIWVNAVAIGIVSPLVNSAYNYWGGLRGGSNDIGRLLIALPPTAVHAYMIGTIILYILGLLVVVATRQLQEYRRRSTA